MYANSLPVGGIAACNACGGNCHIVNVCGNTGSKRDASLRHDVLHGLKKELNNLSSALHMLGKIFDKD